MTLQGTFLDVIGLTYRCGAVEGVTTTEFTFNYDPEVTVRFSIGSIVVGEVMAKPVMTVSDLVSTTSPLSNQSLINRARLLYSLSPGQGFEQPIAISDRVCAP